MIFKIILITLVISSAYTEQDINGWNIESDKPVSGNCVTFDSPDNVPYPSYLQDGDTWTLAMMGGYGPNACFGVGKQSTIDFTSGDYSQRNVFCLNGDSAIKDLADGATEIYCINGALEAEAMGNYVFLYTTSVDRSLLSITHESTGKEMRWDMELDYDYYPWTSTSIGSEVCYNSVISVEPTVVNDWEIRKEESIDGNCVTFADRDNVAIPNFLKNGDTWKIAVMEFGTYVCFGVGKQSTIQFTREGWQDRNIFCTDGDSAIKDLASGATEIYWINGALEKGVLGNYVFLYTESVDRSLMSITHESTGKEMRWDMELDNDYYPWTLTTEGSKVCYNYVENFTKPIDETTSEEQAIVEDCAVIFSECNFSGQSQAICGPEDDLGSFKVASVKVPEGFHLILYNDTDFEGQWVEYFEDQECIDSHDFNDAKFLMQKHIKTSKGEKKATFNSSKFEKQTKKHLKRNSK